MWILRGGRSCCATYRLGKLMRGEDRHYEDAWQALCYLFGVKDALPPRTKRWLEAKVLADCIAVKVSRPRRNNFHGN